MTYHVITTFQDQDGTMQPEAEGSITATGNTPHQIADAADAAMDLFREAVTRNQKYPDAFAVFCFADDAPAFYTVIKH